MAYPNTNPAAPPAFYHLPATWTRPRNASAPNPDGTLPGTAGAGAGIARRVRLGMRAALIGFVQP